jgi:cytochrome c
LVLLTWQVRRVASSSRKAPLSSVVSNLSRSRARTFAGLAAQTGGLSAAKVKRILVMRTNFILAALLMAAVPASPSLAQDAAAGEKVFAKCKACHIASEDKNKVGPSLMGLFGRTAGTQPGFKYSPAMTDAGKGMVKGTKMAFAGLKIDADIANLIIYLKQFSE